VHILFLELIIDPACTVVFEGEEDEPDIMQRPPRRLEEPLFGRSMILSGLIQGLGILAVVVTIYAVMLTRGYGETVARMLAFVCMVIGNLGLIFANRSWKYSILKTILIPNKALWWVTGGAGVFLTLVLTIPFLRDLFKFAPLNSWETALVAFTGLASVLIAESVKIKFVQKFIQGSARNANVHR
jgi:Ca2+-transporting ATPase